MKIEFVSKNYTPTDYLKDIITKKVERLDKFFEDDTRVKIMLKATKDIFTLEITMIIDGNVLRSEVFSDNMFDNIDSALPKLEKQIIKHHTKLYSKNKKGKTKELDMSYLVPQEETSHGIVRVKSYELTPMTIEDAIEQIELIGHSFYVFNNSESAQVNVLYRRKDGDYGVIEAIV